jgi:hypothetical protein
LGHLATFFQDNVDEGSALAIALIAVLVLWGQVGAQSHLGPDALGSQTGSAWAVPSRKVPRLRRLRAWNGKSLRWLGLMLALLLGCGLASYYARVYEEADRGDQQYGEALTSQAGTISVRTPYALGT